PPQLALQAGVESPTPAHALLCEAEPLQGLEPSHAQRLLQAIARLAGFDRHDPLPGAGDQRAIKRGETLLPNFIEPFLEPFNLGLGPQLGVDEGWCSAT